MLSIMNHPDLISHHEKLANHSLYKKIHTIDDLKISVKSQDHELNARLTDLRRQAGCVAMFEELKLGEEIIINAALDEDNVLLRGIVMSK